MQKHFEISKTPLYYAEFLPLLGGGCRTNNYSTVKEHGSHSEDVGIDPGLWSCF